jgi:putative Mg2+ transporter-C (MgtC) family protein
MIFQAEDVIKILLAILLGGLIGGEREARDKSAGFRTIILICVGATLFTMLSSYLTNSTDTARIAANIVTGIGFLGAGAIIREGNQITGLTTAATIWLAASVGMAVGAGEYILSGVVTLATILVLWLFPAIETWIDELRHTYTYQIVCHPDELSCEQLESIFTQHGLKVLSNKRTKYEGKVTMEWMATGKPGAHERFIETLLQNDLVHEFTYY